MSAYLGARLGDAHVPAAPVPEVLTRLRAAGAKVTLSTDFYHEICVDDVAKGQKLRPSK